jgi:hypothetical protein
MWLRTHLHQVPRLKIRGAKLPLHPSSLCLHDACSGTFTFTLTVTLLLKLLVSGRRHGDRFVAFVDRLHSEQNTFRKLNLFPSSGGEVGTPLL